MVYSISYIDSCWDNTLECKGIVYLMVYTVPNKRNMLFIWKPCITPIRYDHIDGLAQERRNSSALAMELRLSCTNPPISLHGNAYWPFVKGIHRSPVHSAQQKSNNVETWSVQWRHNEHNDISNHRHLDCLLHCFFRHRSNKTSKFRVTGLCEGNSPGTGEFTAQRASNAENVSIWWHHHDVPLLLVWATCWTNLSCRWFVAP